MNTISENLLDRGITTIINYNHTCSGQRRSCPILYVQVDLSIKEKML